MDAGEKIREEERSGGEVALPVRLSFRQDGTMTFAIMRPDDTSDVFSIVGTITRASTREQQMAWHELMCEVFRQKIAREFGAVCTSRPSVVGLDE